MAEQFFFVTLEPSLNNPLQLAEYARTIESLLCQLSEFLIPLFYRVTIFRRAHLCVHNSGSHMAHLDDTIHTSQA
jgi:hypothetical protein